MSFEDYEGYSFMDEQLRFIDSFEAEELKTKSFRRGLLVGAILGALGLLAGLVFFV